MARSMRSFKCCGHEERNRPGHFSLGSIFLWRAGCVAIIWAEEEAVAVAAVAALATGATVDAVMTVVLIKSAISLLLLLVLLSTLLE
jgi:hypothetical protein